MNLDRKHFSGDVSRRYGLPLLLVLAALLPAACGKRGPLYLPDEAGAQTRARELAVRPAASPPGNAADEAARKK